MNHRSMVVGGGWWVVGGVPNMARSLRCKTTAVANAVLPIPAGLLQCFDSVLAVFRQCFGSVLFLQRFV